jgi:hypothetical protein
MTEKPPDHVIIDSLTRTAVRVQMRTGTPKYVQQRIMIIVTCILQPCIVAAYEQPNVGKVLAAAGMILGSWWVDRFTWWSRKRDQKIADISGSIVPNSLYHSLPLFWARMALFFISFLIVIPCAFLAGVVYAVLVTASSLLWLTYYFSLACDTYPQVGPSCKDRMKSWLKKPQKQVITTVPA